MLRRLIHWYGTAWDYTRKTDSTLMGAYIYKSYTTIMHHAFSYTAEGPRFDVWLFVYTCYDRSCTVWTCSCKKKILTTVYGPQMTFLSLVDHCFLEFFTSDFLKNISIPWNQVETDGKKSYKPQDRFLILESWNPSVVGSYTTITVLNIWCSNRMHYSGLFFNDKFKLNCQITCPYFIALLLPAG